MWILIYFYHNQTTVKEEALQPEHPAEDNPAMVLHAFKSKCSKNTHLLQANAVKTLIFFF